MGKVWGYKVRWGTDVMNVMILKPLNMYLVTKVITFERCAVMKITVIYQQSFK